MLLSYSQSLHPLRADRRDLARLEKRQNGDVLLLRVDDDDLMTAIQAFVQMLDMKRGEAVDDTIHALVDALGPLHLKDVETSVLMDNARLRRRYLESVETLSSEEVHALSGRKSKNIAETASRWSRDGKIFAVKLGRELRVPSFQFVDGKPRPEIARVLSALPEHQRSGWPAAFWFASGNGFLGCSPQEALDDPSRLEEVVEAAARTGRAIG